MNILTDEEKKFIDENFYEGITEKKLNKEKFNQLNTPYALHYLAEKHNWDDGVKLLQWILENEYCSKATALMVFWLAQPQDYQHYSLNNPKTNCPNPDVFHLIKTIHTNYPNRYIDAVIHMDPNNYIKSNSQIPEFMKSPTSGEDWYIYLEEDDVEDWINSELKNQISRCDNSMELFNIAYFLDEPYDVKHVLDSPLCDKGIALMLYWRMYCYASFFTESDILRAEIERKIKNNELIETIAYDPNKDENIDIKETQNKWEIPDMMYKKI